MADKEPRRRKKKRDMSRKDDVRSDDQMFAPLKSESRDSDQETEEEFIVPSHQPSKFAKCVFLLLFSGLVISMSFIFISLHGAERGPVDIFDDNHAELHSISHEGHDEVESWSDHESLEEDIGDILPGIGSILSYNDEQIREQHDEISIENAEPKAIETEKMDLLAETQADVVDELSKEEESEQPLDLGHTEEYAEITESIVETYTEAPVEATSQDLDYEQEQEILSEQMNFPESTVPLESSVVTEESDTLPDQFTSTEELLSPTTGSTYEDDVLLTTEEEFIDEANPSSKDDVESVYEMADITNDADYEIREQLDEMNQILEKSPEKALKKCEELLKKYSESPRLHYMRAQCLDRLAESQRSNKYLEDAITAYQNVMAIKDVPEKLYLLAGRRAADRMRFRGFMGKSLKLLSDMVTKFPQNTDLKNEMAVGYLLIGQNKEAKKVLIDVLKLAPNSGFAKVHLGFILKTDESKYEEATKLMSEGIASREPGVIDGRFYFHLGDALHRTGKQTEALKVYEDAVKEGLFLSAYQRSLYNVNSLTGKPWWNPEKTPYAPYFKRLEKDWKLIRDEALSLIDKTNSGFLPESEGLQEKGDWKQFEIFARGRKIEKNCMKVPKTCALIAEIPDAAGCKRGQAKFSIMHPSTHVWAHTGPTNCRLRAHLGLVVPEGASIRVANETRKWEEGKIILFDDSFEHEVWHNGSTFRLILIVDFWHPELTAYQKRTLTPI